MSGLLLEGYLYLRYVSDDAESVLVFQEAVRIGAVLVFVLGVLTTGMKLVRQQGFNEISKRN